MANHITLFDTPDQRIGLSPLSLTRSLGELRLGILTIREKWERRMDATTSFLSEDYLGYTIKSSDVFINGGLCPSEDLIAAINHLPEGSVLNHQGRPLAVKTKTAIEYGFTNSDFNSVEFNGKLRLVERPYHLFQWNGEEMEADFDLLTQGRTSATLSSTNTVIGDRIFVEEGVRAEAATFNTTSGPIYLGKNSEVMEGSLVRGGLALCEHAVLKLGAKVYGPTTIGPHSKVGGEISNSVILGYSNKGHDGFMGNSVLGEWCNIGADSNTSNLKNNYAEVRLYHYGSGRFEPTGLQFCGLIMGDHSKCGINTMFNTGTVVGVGANIFGSGFPRNFVPSFAWGGSQGFTTYRLDKMLEVAEIVMERRKVELSNDDRNTFEYLFSLTSKNRFWEVKKDLNI
jgi:UDP-N-acetylglucosamine diphosphorylase/glucosamine-1-phosphate N-acetyltransferase